MEEIKITDYQSVEDDYRAIRELHAIEEMEQDKAPVTTDYSTCGTDIYELVGYKFNSSI